MSHREEVELIKRRSLKMLDYAKKCLSSGDYDLASFLAEQAAQLYLKSILLEITGEMPRTHVIRQLLHVLRELAKNKEQVDEFTRKNRRLLVGLEEAYLAARYFHRIYEREEAEELVKFAEEVIEFAENIEVEA
ncbi:MAG: DNA-binding protein [Thermoprotei archaeon]|nr:MAG: DNA-binding protein [Thermoprotei archaeon]RLE97975.1 MAG: DNA-binding protein [Thermoprotei archaeon]HDI75574.1 HEPN domain-containing protein [Thermoprotei archaeon]